jgi:hypothetical protein
MQPQLYSKPPFSQAYEDDIVPLSEPILDAKGNIIDCIYITKGTTVRIPTATIGTSKRFWGDNGHKFFPDRWLNNDISVSRASEIQGYRHLLAFSVGPRTCPGKGFALVEFKVCHPLSNNDALCRFFRMQGHFVRACPSLCL